MTTVKLSRARQRREPTPESSVKSAVCDFLDLHHIWNTRMNVGGAKLHGCWVKFGRKGMADLLCTPAKKLRDADILSITGGLDVCTEPHILWIETKAPKTGKQREDQLAFQVEVSRAGHSYLLVSDASQLETWLRERGYL